MNPTVNSKKSNTRKLKILVAHGVNLDLLGSREPEYYGQLTLKELNKKIIEFSKIVAKIETKNTFELYFFQSNSEVEFLEKISEGWDGAILNPAAWTHTSLALADRLAALSLPFVEVHLSNLSKREKFRQKSFSAKHALGVVYGFSVDSYLAGLFCLLRNLSKV